ncbi:MAG: hypothetical protein ACREXX_03300 [Gammaproteobacteria bacterium]
MHAERIGVPDAPLVILLHGLSAHLHGFDYVVERLTALDRQPVALDLLWSRPFSAPAAATIGRQNDAKEKEIEEVAKDR